MTDGAFRGGEEYAEVSTDALDAKDRGVSEDEDVAEDVSEERPTDEPRDTLSDIPEDVDASLHAAQSPSRPEGEDDIAEDGHSDSEHALETLPDFRPENWERLSLDDKKESIERLADYNEELLGIEHKPTIDYYSEEAPGDYGAFSQETNSLAINERHLDDGPETADTVAHEFRHAYQYQHAQNPENELDLAYRDNFSNYVAPDQDYAGYKEQVLERDARDYAQRLRDRLE